ncbi:MAG TPA: hypothetical protein VF543_00095 [Pyrinomonadaceae bacterium]|jgi:hypothetical protein
MPFKSTRQGQQLPTEEPDLRIFFHGLLLLRGADEAKFCLVEVHREPQYRHVLSIEARTKTPGEPDVVHMRTLDKLQGEFTIQATPSVANPVVYKFQPSLAFDAVLGNGHAKDFRWIINLEQLHEKPLTVDHTKTRPGIVIAGGVYYFYAAQRKLGPVELKQNGVTKKTLSAVASIIGANLYLARGQEIILTWRDNGKDNRLPLKKPQTGSSHEIYINNSPLFEEQTMGGSHSELKEYYGVLPDVPTEEQFNLEYPFQSLDPDSKNMLIASQGGSLKFESVTSTPTIPCQSVVLDPPSNPDP